MAVLLVVNNDVIKTARLDTANAVDIADAAFVVTGEQTAIEAEIHPAALTDPALVPLLLRNVTKLLAAEVLDMRTRAAGATGTYQGGGITIGQEWDHASRLRTEARLALGPYLSAGGIKDPAFVGPVTALSDLDTQDRLFGRTEADRRRTDDLE
jgi:hypothetical protein